MASFVKFYSFSEALAEGVHNLGSDTIKVMLSNTAPSQSNTVKADITEISAGNGYTAGGNTLTVSSSSQTSGLYKMVVADSTFTASGGSMAAARYAIIFNDTPTSPADPLIGYYDYSSSVTLANGESLVIDFSATDGLLQLS